MKFQPLGRSTSLAALIRLRKESRTVKEVAVEEVDDFSLYRTIAEEDPFPYSDSLHVDFLRAFGK